MEGERKIAVGKAKGGYVWMYVENAKQQRIRAGGINLFWGGNGLICI